MDLLVKIRLGKVNSFKDKTTIRGNETFLELFLTVLQLFLTIFFVYACSISASQLAAGHPLARRLPVAHDITAKSRSANLLLARLLVVLSRLWY